MLAIIRMYTFKKRFVCSAKLSRSKTEQRLDPVGPMKIAGLDIPVPTANIRSPLGQSVSLLA
jgi:hypothetical protein